MKKNGIYLTIAIPCYNEENNLKKGVLANIRSYLTKKHFGWEVIISDDGSTDKSRDFVKKQIRLWKNFRLLENAHGGKPSALWHAVKSSKGEYILFTDMDQSTPISQLSKLLPFAEDFDAVIGSRGLARKNFPAYRKLGAFVFATFRKALVLPSINDTQCGFKLFKKAVALTVFPKLEFFKTRRKVKGWSVTSWDVEFLFIMQRLGLTIKEVVVDWSDQDASISKGGALFRYFKESKDMVAQIIRVRINSLRGLYDFSD